MPGLMLTSALPWPQDADPVSAAVEELLSGRAARTTATVGVYESAKLMNV